MWVISVTSPLLIYLQRGVYVLINGHSGNKKKMKKRIVRFLFIIYNIAYTKCIL